MRDKLREDRSKGSPPSIAKVTTSIVKCAPIFAVVGVAVFGFSPAAFAQQSGDSERQCLAEVRETMVREQVKQLDPKMRQSVTELCKLGNTGRATGMVTAVGAYQRCTQGVDAHITDNNLDVAKDVRSQAYGACRGGDLKQALRVVAGSPTKELAGEAEIVSFVASSGKIKKGNSVTLSWQTSNATLIIFGRIDPSDKAGISDRRTVAASGSLPVTPDKTTTYVLMAANTAKGAAPMQSRKLEVQVSGPPNIFRFQAGPSTVRRGTKSTLNWDVYDAEKVTLNGAPVAARGDRTVTPQRTTGYVLKAQSGDEVVEEHATIHVSPFPPATLSSPFKSIELCQEVDRSGASFRCVHSDGPFWGGKKVFVIVRFSRLARGPHRVRQAIYDSGVFGNGKWKGIHRSEQSFNSSKPGYAEISFEIPNPGKGVRKLELVLDDDKSTRSETRYCVECPGHDEW
jgi:hypothetical protein